jgi:DNA-binding MarR family transcriptional regulator
MEFSEELPKPVVAALVDAEAVKAGQRYLLATDGLSPSKAKIYELLGTEGPNHIEELVEISGLNSREVLATLFNLEMKGIVRPERNDAPERKLGASGNQQGRLERNLYKRWREGHRPLS